jgi:hypothetical protein
MSEPQGPPKPARRKKKRKKPVVFDAYRADVSRALAWVLGIAAALVLVGSFASGSAVVAARLEGIPIFAGRNLQMEGAVAMGSPAPSSTPFFLGVLGLCLIAGGAGTAILGLRHVLREERYLLLRKDGALFVRGNERSLVRWRDVEDVIHEDGQLVFVCHDGRALTVDERYGGVSGKDLAKRAAQLRRRAVFGLLR